MLGLLIRIEIACTQSHKQGLDPEVGPVLGKKYNQQAFQPALGIVSGLQQAGKLCMQRTASAYASSFFSAVSPVLKRMQECVWPALCWLLARAVHIAGSVCKLGCTC